jgi:hypothetical protein
MLFCEQRIKKSPPAIPAGTFTTKYESKRLVIGSYTKGYCLNEMVTGSSQKVSTLLGITFIISILIAYELEPLIRIDSDT